MVLDVRRVERPEEPVRSGLTDVLIDCVEGGASIGFVLPLDRTRADAYWARAFDEVERGDRILITATDRGEVLGTVQVIVAVPENQPHRADVSKMLVRRSARKRGVGHALMMRAEAEALAAGRSLLVLDTASADAYRLYRRLGWVEVGVIPEYALGPSGDYVDTTVFYKRLRDYTPDG